MFHLDLAPADPILGLTETFKADTHPDKINLGVGVYQDTNGRTPVLAAVKQAERLLLETETSKEYQYRVYLKSQATHRSYYSANTIPLSNKGEQRQHRHQAGQAPFVLLQTF